MGTRIAAAAAGLLLFLVPAASSDRPLDTSAVYALLDVIDAIMAAHPDYEAEAARIDTLDADARAAALLESRDANAGNEAITSRIDALLSTTAYQLYFRQFRFTKPQTHRDLLLSLPYEAARGPDAVSENLKELCRHRREVRAWVDGTLARVDLDASVESAARWLPPGDYRPYAVHFIYDGTGDAFASMGGIVFDVFSVVFHERPAATRFEHLDGAGLERIEDVIAHEYHHAFARPLARMPTPSTALERREQRVAARMVSEGVAMRCDLEPGMRRDVIEDPAVVAGWIEALNDKFAATSTGTLSDDDWEAWLEASYGELAMERLQDYFERTRPGEDANRLARVNARARPMLVYTLGWTMINRIAQGPGGRQRVLALLESPHRVFAEYNRTLPEDEKRLRIDTSYE